MRLAALPLALACFLAAHAGEPPMPLHVKAWRKTGKPKSYSTRLVSHLEGFEPGDPPTLSPYGGLMGRRLKATGFFHARKLGGRWWLIDPDGCRFLHVAVNGVRHGTSPQPKRALPAKFGTVGKWRDATIALLRRHGFNGTGCWSDDATLRGAKQRLAYTPQWNFMSSYGRKRGGVYQKPGHMGYPSSCIFVFDPEFESFCDEHARKLAATKDDPWLLGHFSDNEMPFPSDSLDRHLKLPKSEPGRKAAEAWLARRKGAAAAKIGKADRSAWLQLVAERYLRIVSTAIRKHDPNHMYLGPRFHGGDRRKPELWRAAGKHCDAIAVNVYGTWTPSVREFRQWGAWAAKPVLVTEWYAKGADSGLKNLTGAGWTVPTQADRGRFYQNFVLGLIETKVCVGWHWFKYMDNDPESKTADPSNLDSNKGIVRTSYQPYTPLLDAMAELNAVVYPLVHYFDSRN